MKTDPCPMPVCATVYSVVWPDTQALVSQCMREETDAMLDAHQDAHTKRQDGMHEPFFDAWARFADPVVPGLPNFPHHYPTAGSSEAIREIIRRAGPRGQVLVVMEGEYEGYEAIARTQGTVVVSVERRRWREVLDSWRRDGAPWGAQGAQWWVSQPSALDGNAWEEFGDWLDACGQLPGLEVWVDLTYVGGARLEGVINLTDKPWVAGVVMSLSKVMGAYYRRIGGCLSREPVEGLWANMWFKNLDSLYLGRRWLEQGPGARERGAAHARLQQRAMDRALEALGGRRAWEQAGVFWQPSHVPLLMWADPGPTPVLEGAMAQAWEMAGRGAGGRASRRLCLTPSLVAELARSRA